MDGHSIRAHHVRDNELVPRPASPERGSRTLRSHRVLCVDRKSPQLAADDHQRGGSPGLRGGIDPTFWLTKRLDEHIL